MREVSRPEGCSSDLAFDELHAGELAADARAKLEAHLSGCARCLERQAALSCERERLLAAAPSLDALSASRTRAVQPKPRAPLIAIGGAALALAAAAMLMLTRDGVSGSDTRSKGAPHLGAFVKRGEHVRAAASGARVRPGDLVRFTYSSDRERHIGLVSLDAKGAQIYFPTDGSGTAARARAGSLVALDFSVELDATQGDEQVFGLFCDEPLALEPLRAELARKGALPALAGCAVDRLVLHKELTP